MPGTYMERGGGEEGGGEGEAVRGVREVWN